MPKEVAGNIIIDELGGPQPNFREHNVGAIKAGSSNKFGSTKVSGGFKLADVSSNIPSRPDKPITKSNPNVGKGRF